MESRPLIIMVTATGLAFAISLYLYHQHSPRKRATLQTSRALPPASPLVLAHKNLDKSQTKSTLCTLARTFCPNRFGLLSDEEISTEQLQGGITNLLWKVTNDMGASCLVRAYGENTEVMIDREKECLVFAELSKRGFGPKLWGRFANGRVEGYFDAKALDPPSKMGERVPVDFPVLIARQLARMHEIEDMPVPKNAQIWTMIDKFYALAKQISFNRDEAKSRALVELDLPGFEKEIEWMKSVLPSKQNDHGKTLPGVSPAARSIAFRQVFCHNDLLAGNILYLAAENRCQLIDFEYGAYNYAAFDIADHFCEYAGFDFDLKRWYPALDTQMHFWNAYIMAGGFSADDQVVHEMVRWTNKFTSPAHALWFLWAVIQSKHSVIDVDFLAYAGRRREGYFLHKKEYF